MYSNAAISRAACFRSYDQALKFFKKTKPIRGRITVPLGARRDHEALYIRTGRDSVDGRLINEVDAVQCVLHKTPVVTFLSTGELLLRSDGWATASTAAFITQVSGVLARMSKRSLYVCVEGNWHKLAVDRTANKTPELVLRRGEGERSHLWVLPPEVPRVQAWGINRRAANNVRSRFREFFTYLDSMLKLTRNENGAVELTIALIDEAYAQVVENSGTGLDKISVGGWTLPSAPKPAVRNEPRTVGAREALLGYMLSEGKTDEQKAKDFEYAFVLLVAHQYPVMKLYRSFSLPMGLGMGAGSNPDTMKFSGKTVMRDADKFVMMMHAEQVLVKRDVKPGAFPSTTYNGWIE